MKNLVIKKSTLYSFSIGLLTIAFVTFYFTDGLGKILRRGGSEFYRYSAFLKGFFEIFALGFSLIAVSKSKINILLGITMLLFGFLIGQLFLSLNFKNLLFFENFNTLFKYFFPLIIALIALNIIGFNQYPDKLFKYYKAIIILNSCLLILGFLFDIEVLTTYSGPWRFGYDGLIFAQNEATYIFIFAITTVYYRRFYLDIKEYFFWIVIIPSIIVATKGVYLYLILLLLFHIFKRVSLRNILAFGISFLVFGYFLFSSAINKIFINSYNIFMYMYEREGLWGALLSGRGAYITEKLKPLILEQWTIPNFIFGGQDVVSHYIEMGFLDLFLFFGIFGSILYLYIFYSIFKIISFPKEFKLFFGISLAIIVATAGHFFESGIAGLHFIFLILMNRNLNNKLQNA
ncbi:hypothetical protein [Aequorivita nionensis]|uniref:hypothetical protein n=1 Tax=Aequorivita nionensis TaxID=1287690 RepID=UPI003965A506